MQRDEALGEPADEPLHVLAVALLDVAQAHALEPCLDEVARGIARKQAVLALHVLAHGAHEPVEDVVGVADAVDDDQSVLVAVVLDQREGLLLVEIETPVDRVRGVVVALLDVAAAHVADPRRQFVAGRGVVGATVAADAT